MPKHDLLCAFICGSGVVPRRFLGSRIVQGVPGGVRGGPGGVRVVPRGRVRGYRGVLGGSEGVPGFTDTQFLPSICLAIVAKNTQKFVQPSSVLAL